MSTPLVQPAARQLWAALRMLHRDDRARRARLPARDDRLRPGGLPRPRGRVHRRAATARSVGSSLIGQSFDGKPEYFQSRPSAAGDGYDPLASSASNLGPENEDLIAAIEERRQAAAELDGTDPAEVAPDALLASGSGLDPHISPEYAEQQVARIARERGLVRGRRTRSSSTRTPTGACSASSVSRT